MQHEQLARYFRASAILGGGSPLITLVPARGKIPLGSFMEGTFGLRQLRHCWLRKALRPGATSQGRDRRRSAEHVAQRPGARHDVASLSWWLPAGSVHKGAALPQGALVRCNCRVKGRGRWSLHAPLSHSGRHVAVVLEQLRNAWWQADGIAWQRVLQLLRSLSLPQSSLRAITATSGTPRPCGRKCSPRCSQSKEGEAQASPEQGDLD